jgi:hypothetical protein
MIDRWSNRRNKKVGPERLYLQHNNYLDRRGQKHALRSLGRPDLDSIMYVQLWP